MKMNALIYPFKTIRITQSYSEGAHKKHTTGDYKDYPLDDGGKDGNRDYFHCPCDHMTVKRLYGNADVGYHIWLESNEKVDFADGSRDYCTIFAVHLNSDDYYNLKLGQKFKRDDKIFREGKSGNATGNHIHFSVGKGRCSKWGKWWIKNSKNAWVLTTPNGTLKPEKAFFITDDIKIIDSTNLKFKKLKVIVTGKANVRSGAGISYKKIGKVYKGEIYEVSKDKYINWIKLKNQGFVSKKYLKIYYK
jgi:murein DD-endopeptidase MepM/ murein hydrolase activator NlpD